MKATKLLYDASVIIENINSKTANRSGIYWVAYNVLLQLSQSSLYKTALFIPHNYFHAAKCQIKYGRDHFLSSFPLITIYDENILKNNIKFHTEYIKGTKNIFVIGLRLLKILKNVMLLLASKKIPEQVDGFDIYISPVYAIPDKIKNNTSIKSFHILYDCVPILDNISFPPKDPNHWFSILLQNLNKGTYYFCISECTKKDFLRAAPMLLDEKKVFVTPIATSQNFFPKNDKSLLQKALSKYGVDFKPTDNYVFSFSTIDPRKNLVFTMNCFIKFIKKHQINNLFFYLGGGHFDAYASQFQHEISDFSDYADKIIRLGYVDDEDVNILYSGSLFFTYLSQYEGFGLPPLEAMQAGTPVITSNNSSLPEVVGDAAITIDYNSEEQCIKAFEDLYFSEEIRKKYIERGIERAKLFSWEKTFRLMSDVIVGSALHETSKLISVSNKKKVLFIFHLNFLRKDIGCSNAVYITAKMLKSMGFSIDFFTTNIIENYSDFVAYNNEGIIDNLFLVDINKKSSVNKPQSYSKISWVLSDIVLEEFQELVKSVNYNYIYVHYINWAELFRFTKISASTKLIYNMHDSYFVQLFYHEGIKEIGKHFEEELDLLNYFHAVLCISHDEMLFWSRFYPDKKFYFLPAANQLKKLPIVSKTIDVLYIAALNSYNVTAANWFIDEICPKLQKNISITFCGKFLTGLQPEYLEKIKNHNITTIDFAEDLELLYAKSRIVVVPILGGTGLKIKTLEALSCSIPIVSTVLGVDGLPDKYESGCLVSDDPGEFAAYLQKLLSDEGYYNLIKEKQRIYYNKYLSVERNLTVMKEVFEA